MLALATAGFGVSTLIRKLAVDKIHPLQYEIVTASVHILIAPICWYLVRRSDVGTAWSTTGVSWAILAMLIHVPAAVLFGIALRNGNDTGIVSSLVSASPIITLMLSFMILGEQPTLMGMIGMALVLIGIVFMTY